MSDIQYAWFETVIRSEAYSADERIWYWVDEPSFELQYASSQADRDAVFEHVELGFKASCFVDCTTVDGYVADWDERFWNSNLEVRNRRHSNDLYAQEDEFVLVRLDEPF